MPHPSPSPAAVSTHEDPRWLQVVSRDAGADGSFLYSVSSTGVFCRPSCPSRTADPRHIRFHDSVADCLATGYRPCLRCRPDAPPRSTRDAAILTRACRLIEQSEAPRSVASLAAAVGLSRAGLHRLFIARLGVTPRDYAAAHRAAQVADLLVREPTVTASLHAAGFGSASRFYDADAARLGMTPSAYRAGAPDTTIRFALGPCSLGTILVACSPRGVCAIQLGDDPDQLVQALQDRFGRAELVGDDSDFDTLVAQAIALADAPREAAGRPIFPLDIRGTAFQQRVWAALRQIPVGETVSYAALATRIGTPGSSRAVAGACAANMIALAIPCHRVVRTDGSLSGYRWGVARKRTLLDRERPDPT